MDDNPQSSDEKRWPHDDAEFRERLRRRVIERAHRGHHFGGMRHSGAAGVVFAGFLIVIGVLIFLENTGLLHFREVWRYWPVVLIALGLSKMYESRGWDGRLWGLMFVAGGTLLLLDNLGVMHFRFAVIWPLVLIWFGAVSLLRALERRKFPRNVVPVSAVGSGDSAFAGDSLKEWAVFSGIKRRLNTQNFQGGELFAVFGGIEIDLRHANLSPSNGSVIIDANATFGGIDIRVPDHWRVITRGLGVFGGYEDKTIPPKPQDGVTTPEVVITGNAVFGGVSVDN